MTMLGLRRNSKGLGLSPRRARHAANPPSGDTEAPSIPQNLNAVAVSGGQIDLTWDASTDNVGVTGYNMYRDNMLVDTSPTNSYSDSGLDPGTEYDYEVSAFDAAANESARSAPASATTHQVIVFDGLVAEWRFDDGLGQQLTDYSGNGNHGMLGPTAGSDPEDPTWAATGLTGDADDEVNLPAGMIAAGNQDVTMLVVVTDFTSSGNFQLMFHIGTSNNQQSLSLTVRNNDDIYFSAWGDTLVSDTPPSLPYSFGGTYNSATGERRAYINGAYSADHSSTTTTALNLPSSAAAKFFETTTGGLNFQGGLAYGLLYDRVLSDEEMAQVHAALTTILAPRGITLP